MYFPSIPRAPKIHPWPRSLQHCGGQHFTLSAAKVVGPAEDFRTETNKGLGNDVHLQAVDIDGHWLCSGNG